MCRLVCLTSTGRLNWAVPSGSSFRWWALFLYLYSYRIDDSPGLLIGHFCEHVYDLSPDLFFEFDFDDHGITSWQHLEAHRITPVFFLFSIFPIPFLFQQVSSVQPANRSYTEQGYPAPHSVAESESLRHPPPGPPPPAAPRRKSEDQELLSQALYA